MFQINSAKFETLFDLIETPSFLKFKNGGTAKGVNFPIIY
jgi:hypothetical protein